MTSNISIKFAPIIRTKISGLKIGLLAGKNLTVTKNSDFVKQQFADLERYIKDKFSDRPPSGDPVVSAVRRMYRRIGWEPTQYRPSSEAMIRRFLKDKGLYRINNLVDLGNVASTRFHLPMGLYDMDKISGTVLVDVGKDGEEYQGISKDVIHASGKLVLRDSIGIFGNPTADSARTCIQNDTNNVLALFFTPPEVDNTWLDQTLDFMENLYKIECQDADLGKETIMAPL